MTWRRHGCEVTGRLIKAPVSIEFAKLHKLKKGDLTIGTISSELCPCPIRHHKKSAYSHSMGRSGIMTLAAYMPIIQADELWPQ